MENLAPDFRYLQNRIASFDDKQAYKKVFMHFFPRLRSFVLSVIGSAETAEEIASDSLLQVWLRRAELPAINNLAAWLYTSARNRALNHLNKSAQSSILSLELQDVEYIFRGADPEQELISRELIGQINDAVNELPPKCKLIFKMIREDGLRYKEVAGILNISVNTIDTQMAIAVKRILKRAGYKKDSSGKQARIVPLYGKK